MSKRTGHIALGAFLSGTGANGASWRLPEADPASAGTFALYARVARKLEGGCFDTLFMNDGVGISELDPAVLARNAQALRWDPLTLLPALAVVTSRIGLTATANTSYNEPYTLARRFASLDQISAGRAGWNAVTSLGGGPNYNRDDHLAHEERYNRAEEFMDVITALWDSCEDGAAIMDKATGIWLDVSKIHRIHHKGTHFQVQGPLNAPRPVQGHPVITQAGSSAAGRELAARTAEVVFTAAQTIDEARDFCADIAARAAKYGRTRKAFRILPGVSVVVAETQAEAEAKYDRLHDLVDPTTALKSLSRFASLGVDLSDYPLDGPVPLRNDVPLTNTHRSRQQLVMDMIRRERPTIRQLLRMMTAGGHRLLIGTPAAIADDFATWFEAGACDGFNIMFKQIPEGVDDFVDLVIPELQRRGMFREAYTGTTLREHLNLPRPANRFAAQKEAGQ
jgi:FMN-dependent oxidoreductase (nitrilotriacetate monooxygenase family)